MSRKVDVISTSLRAGSNSEKLAEAFADGAREAGHEVELISLKGKKLSFCMGCLACQKTGVCAIRDDAIAIEGKVLQADVVAFATPIYYYEMSGQMKTLLDRMNSLCSRDYRFRDIYLLTTAAEKEEHVPEGAIQGLQGWIDCFEQAELMGTLFCGGMENPGQIEGNGRLRAAFAMGKKV